MLSYKQIFQNRQPGKKPDILESPCYPRLLGYLEIWETFQKETFARFQSHGQHAAGGFIETRNAIEHCCFTGSVRSDNCCYLAALDLETKIINRDKSSKSH